MRGDRQTLAANGGGIACMVVDDLEKQERVDGVSGFGAARKNPNFGAAIGFGKLIANLRPEASHGGDAWRIRVVNEHRRGEIAVREHAHDVGKVHADFGDTGFVFNIICGDEDFATVSQKMKVVRGGVMGKAHDVVAAVSHGILARRLRLLRRSLGVLRNERRCLSEETCEQSRS